MRTPYLLQRRSFLVGAGGLALAIPFLPSLARAQTAPVQRTFFTWRIANGYFGQHWYPSDAVLATAQLVEPNVRELALSSISGPISPILDASFDAYRSQMLLLRHVDHLAYETGHAPVTGLTGFNTSTTASTWNDLNPGVSEASLPPSIDQLIAAKLSGPVTKPPLNLSINYTGNGGWSCSYKKGSTGRFEQQPGLYPRTAFDLLFANLPGTDPVAARRLRSRTSAIDLVKSHFDAVRTNPKLSSEDKAALSRYVDELHQLGQRLDATGQGQCTPPGAPATLQPTEQSVDAMATAHVDIALAAMKCGLTKVVNFYLDPDVVMPGIGGRGHHSLARQHAGRPPGAAHLPSVVVPAPEAAPRGARERGRPEQRADVPPQLARLREQRDRQPVGPERHQRHRQQPPLHRRAVRALRHRERLPPHRLPRRLPHRLHPASLEPVRRHRLQPAARHQHAGDGPGAR